MVDIRKTYKSIYQNLIDACCNKTITDKCMLLVEDCRVTEMLSILATYRESLLSSVHAGQKKIDCLDFLIYTLKKNENNSKQNRRSDL